MAASLCFVIGLVLIVLGACLVMGCFFGIAAQLPEGERPRSTLEIAGMFALLQSGIGLVFLTMYALWQSLKTAEGRREKRAEILWLLSGMVLGGVGWLLIEVSGVSL